MYWTPLYLSSPNIICTGNKYPGAWFWEYAMNLWRRQDNKRLCLLPKWSIAAFTVIHSCSLNANQITAARLFTQQHPNARNDRDLHNDCEPDKSLCERWQRGEEIITNKTRNSAHPSTGLQPPGQDCLLWVSYYVPRHGGNVCAKFHCQKQIPPAHFCMPILANDMKYLTIFTHDLKDRDVYRFAWYLDKVFDLLVVL